MCCLCCCACAEQAESPSSPVRTPAEWESVQGVVTQWDFNECDRMHRFLVRHIGLAGATNYIVVEDAENERLIRAHLAEHDLDALPIEFIHTPTDSLWARDYSPASIYFGAEQRPGLINTAYSLLMQDLDEAAPQAIAAGLGRPVFSLEQPPRRVVLDWGDFMSDGFGTAVSSSRVLEDNDDRDQVAALLGEYMGIERYLIVEKLSSERDKHLDMYMKFADEETIVIARYPPDSPNYPIVERNVEYLRAQPNCYGLPYRIVRIPMPGDSARNDFRTYTNALFVNHYVLVPVYGIEMDAEALEVWQRAMPGYRIVGFNATNVASQNGAIHCMTHQVAAPKVLRIAHARIRHGLPLGSEVQIRAKVDGHEEARDVRVHLKSPGADEYAAHALSRDAQGLWSYAFRTDAIGATEYYLEARSETITTYKPANAAHGGRLTFHVIGHDR